MKQTKYKTMRKKNTFILMIRNELMKYLSENNIETKIQHPLLMSQQKPYLNCLSETPNALRIVKRILCLPIHESLEQDDVDYVIEKVTEFFS